MSQPPPTHLPAPAAFASAFASTFPPAALPFAIATLVGVVLVIGTLSFLISTAEAARRVAARVITLDAPELDRMQELRAIYQRRTLAFLQVTQAATAGQQRAAVEALGAQRDASRQLVSMLIERRPAGPTQASLQAIQDVDAALTGVVDRIIALSTSDPVQASLVVAGEALPLLDKGITQIERAAASRRLQVGEQGRAALSAMAVVRTQVNALACLLCACLVTGLLWFSRTRRPQLTSSPATHAKTPPPLPAEASASR